MFTALAFDANVAALATCAGPSYLWPGVSGSARPTGATHKRGGTARQGMRAWLFAAQGGVCPHCDTDMIDPHSFGLDLAHVVGAGAKRVGYVAGNIYLSHAACNVAAARAHGAMTSESAYHLTLTAADFSRPDVIAQAWPVRTVGAFVQFAPNHTTR